MYWDVFLSYSRTHASGVARLATLLRDAGLRVFVDSEDVELFAPISPTALTALHESKLLLAYYSADYPGRPACQFELMTAYLAGQRDGDPLRRLCAVNPEPSWGHVQPVQLRDMLIPAPPGSDHGRFVGKIAAAVAALPTPIGDEPAAMEPHGSFLGRWHELWELHSALSGGRTPLTSGRTDPVVVLHGPPGVGKTTLATEYLHRFGAAFDGGPPTVLDDVTGEPRTIRANLPGGRVLVVTRDPRLRTLGHELELTDLPFADVATQLPDIGEHEQEAVYLATFGSPEVRARTATLAEAIGVEAALDRLHGLAPDLVTPLADRLREALTDMAPPTADVLRSLVAAAPLPLSRTQLRAVHPASDVDAALTALVGTGVVPDTLARDNVALLPATVLALRRTEREPARTERVRVATLRMLSESRAGLGPLLVPSRAAVSERDVEAERNAAHRIQVQLQTRVSGRPLPENEGMLSNALQSLYTLLTSTRDALADLPPSANRPSTAARPSFVDVATRLMAELEPELTTWHPRLHAHEDVRPARRSRLEHEREWEHAAALRASIESLRHALAPHAESLRAITGVWHL